MEAPRCPQTSSPTRSQRFDASQGPRKVGPTNGPVAQLGGCDARFLVFGEESGGGFSLVEHPVPPRSLCAPLHRHHGVDEYSFVLEGRMGALLGDDVIYAEAGDLAFKPRDQWHTFWNAGDEPLAHPRDHLPSRLRALLPRVRPRRRRTAASTRWPWATASRSSSTWRACRRSAPSTTSCILCSASLTSSSCGPFSRNRAASPD